MKHVSVTEAKAHLTTLVRDAETEDVAVLRHGRPAAVIISASRYEELLDRVEDLDDELAVEQFRASGEPTVEAGAFFARLGL